MLDTRTGTLLAVVLALLVPIAVRAETVVFTNDCRLPMIVQTATVQRGVLKRDQCLLRPGESTVKMPLSTDKAVTIYCGKTGRVLHREALRVSKNPLQLSITPDPRMGGKVRMVPVRTIAPEVPMPKH